MGAIDEVVGLLQEAVFDESRWPELAVSIDSACGLIGSQLCVVAADVDDTVPDFRFNRGLIRGEPQEDLESEYIEHYHSLDERIPRMRLMRPGRLYHNTDLLTESEQIELARVRGLYPAAYQ